MKYYREDLQILRGFAVILVVFYHLQIVGFDNGFLGVDLFFVLSGYFMALLSEKTNVLEFYRRRLYRLVPAYFVTVLITMLAVVLITLPVDANQSFNQLWFDVIGLSNIGIWLKSSYFNNSYFRPLLHLWSLGVEIQFYLIAPILLPFLRIRQFLLLITLFGLLIVTLIILTISPKTSFFMMPTRLWEFLFGAYIAWYPLKVISESKNKILSYISFVFLIAVIFVYPLQALIPSVYLGHPGIASIFVVITTGILISTTLKYIINYESIIGKCFAKLGDYSYSIYLTHFPIIVLLNYIPFGGTIIGSKNFIDFTVIILATAVFSYLMFNFVEVIRFKKNFRFIVSGITVATLLVGVFGSYLNNLRFSEKQNLIFDAWEDRSVYRCGKIIRIFSPSETICRIGSKHNKQKILLIGNSHADSIKFSFTDVMDKNGLSTYFIVDNNPLYTPTSVIKIKNDIEQLNIKTVVIHNNIYNEPFYVKQLEKFLELMIELEVDVLFIAPVPAYKFHIPNMLYLKTLDETLSIPRLSVKDYLTINSEFFRFIKKAKIETDKVFFPHIYLCKDEVCLIEYNHQPIYFDTSHLTITGSNLLTSLFETIVNKIRK